LIELELMWIQECIGMLHVIPIEGKVIKIYM